MKVYHFDNVFRVRSFGWGYSITPQRNGGIEIEIPDRPDYTGTLSQIERAKDADRTWQSVRNGTSFYCHVWFYRGKRINYISHFGQAWVPWDFGFPPRYYPKGLWIETED